MRVAFRVDASREIGSGHVMRCIALAHALAEQGAEIVFLCQQLPGSMERQIQEAGFVCWLLTSVQDIEDDADQTNRLLDQSPGWDWLIVDHYALSVRWSRILRARIEKLMAIDDLANRLLGCDVLLDQNLNANPAKRYKGLVPPDAVCLFGPEFALLRPEFAKSRNALRPRSGEVARIFVCFGGADAPNATGRVLETLLPVFPHVYFDVALGAANPHCESLQALCAQYSNVTLSYAKMDVATRMLQADLFIGSGGSMTWERAALALPGITLSIADNQQALSRLLARMGEGRDLGMLEDFSAAALVDTLRALIASPATVRAMGQALAKRCDGHGAERVAQILFDQTLMSLSS
ncbi:UDP-2,4-diacetamido-2,4,6-trideoxy-beta-L-altropyranose hydrolase [Uliginosibacterium gangwonense]|uniref:UDP-2,4-diacetamido-2,4, 6-trideoxy-beta-L-altropyranose hydrolase n=1 Tax=Uliginosibacterium gangwonense TaxID=392736 RepID=UPI00035FE84F|nr:UDP-2,4-diacetamido-2,4,6-trideoxy-beta-L-altropyranose hydrolase [Uliginosibacterium gangwonense]